MIIRLAGSAGDSVDIGDTTWKILDVRLDYDDGYYIPCYLLGWECGYPITCSALHEVIDGKGTEFEIEPKYEREYRLVNKINGDSVYWFEYLINDEWIPEGDVNDFKDIS